MENNFNIGELDTLVTVFRAEQEQGAQGNKKTLFQVHSQVWANVERNINEMVSNGNLEEGNMIELTCYKIPGLTVRWRIELEGVSYEITAINPVSRYSALNVLSLRAID